MPPELAVLIDRRMAGPYAASTFEALDHAVRCLDVPVTVREIPTREIESTLLAGKVGGVLVGPGSPYDEPERVLSVIASARERGVPLVGT